MLIPQYIVCMFALYIVVLITLFGLVRLYSYAHKLHLFEEKYNKKIFLWNVITI